MPYTVYNSVSDLIAGTESSRASGRVWRGGRVLLREAPAVATDHHVTNAGGVKLYLDDDNADASVVGAAETADPMGRGTYAPALVTSMQARRLRGVSLREILGRQYTPPHDAGATLNEFIPELAAAGIVITDPDNLEMRVTQPIRIQSNLKMHLGPKTTFVKEWTGGGGEADSMFAAAHWGTDVDDFEFTGGILTALNSSQRGKLMSIWGRNYRISGTKFLDWWGGQALIHGGTDGRITDCLFHATEAIGGTGPCRMLGGTGFRGIGLHAYGGDDLFQFVPSSSQTNARFDQSISDSYYIGCHGQSWTARVCIAGIIGAQDENAMTATIRDSGFIGCSGKGGNRCLVIEENEGDGTVARQIDNITVANCHFDGSEQSDETTMDAFVWSSFAGAIGQVKIANTTIGKDTKRKFGLTCDAAGSRIVLDNLSCQGETSAVRITEPCTVHIHGGRFEVIDSGGGHAPNWVVEAGGSSGAVQLEVSGFPVFNGIASSKSGLRLGAGAGVARVGSIEVHKASGASETAALSATAGAVAKLGDVIGSTDTDTTGGGTVTRVP